MTKIHRLSMAAGATALLALGTLAGAAERGPGRDGPGGPRAVDTNNDGAVDFSELQSRRSDLTTEQFNAMDSDKNGTLNRDEMRAAMRAEMQARASNRFKELDTNGDGGLSQQEMAAAREQRQADRFKRLDADGDGKVTEAEMAAARDQMRQRMDERRGQRGPGGDRRGPPPERN